MASAVRGVVRLGPPGSVRDPRQSRRRWIRRRLPRPRSGARPGGRDQDAAPSRGRRHARGIAARGARRVGAEPPLDRHHPRLRRRRRLGVHRHGVGRGRDPARDDGARASSHAHRLGSGQAARLRADARARRRHRAPRSQARERDGAPGRRAQGPRLRLWHGTGAPGPSRSRTRSPRWCPGRCRTCRRSSSAASRRMRHRISSRSACCSTRWPPDGTRSPATKPRSRPPTASSMAIPSRPAAWSTCRRAGTSCCYSSCRRTALRGSPAARTCSRRWTWPATPATCSSSRAPSARRRRRAWWVAPRSWRRSTAIGRRQWPARDGW